MLGLIYGAEIEISDIMLFNKRNVVGEEQERRLPSRMAPLNSVRIFSRGYCSYLAPDRRHRQRGSLSTLYYLS